MEPVAVLIMAKAPRAGEVKTRLCPPLTAAEAAELYRSFLLDKIEQVRALTAVSPAVAYTPAEGRALFESLAPGFTLLPQRGADLGARLAIDVASDRQATDILMLDVHELTPFADFLVIMTANSARQLNALADELEEKLRKAGVKLHHREGTPDSGWLLLDFADVVIHIFSETQRDFYSLDQVWSAARQVVRLQ